MTVISYERIKADKPNFGSVSTGAGKFTELVKAATERVERLNKCCQKN